MRLRLDTLYIDILKPKPHIYNYSNFIIKGKWNTHLNNHPITGTQLLVVVKKMLQHSLIGELDN